MMGIRDKLLLVIGDSSINQWARDRELPPQTVHGWIDKDRMPRKGGMETLVKATGIPEEWWLHGDGPPPVTNKTYPVSDKATALKLKSPEHGFNDGFDPLLMHHVIVAVEKMLKKHGKTIDPEKKADLFFLIHDCCKAAGGMDDSIVERFVSVAG